jgi:redox-sensitive bicupin YhaK (pirin superfamily)
MIIEKITASDRHFSDFGWLKTYWLFSFSDYYDPENIQFGALRVFNDDVVTPGTGFPTHPHQEMEIVTIVLEGEMTHQDSLGNKTLIPAGDVQRMSAGKGITHSEFNLAKKDVHFYQIWIYPDTKGLSPSYDQKSFAGVSRKNKLLPVASGQNIAGTVSFYTDATIYLSELETEKTVSLKTNSSRRIFVYVTSGEIEIDSKKFKAKDQARIDPEKNIVIKAEKDSEFILIDIPSCRGYGYDKKTLRGSKN